MRISDFSRYALSICAAAAFLAGCGGSQLPIGAPGGAASLLQQSGSSSTPIAHVVFIVQENRSFDDFFALFPGADGATRGKMKWKVGGKYVDRWVTLQPRKLVMKTDIQHCHKAFVTDYDGGKMDGFGLSQLGVCPKGGQLAGKLVYQYVEQSEIQPYWDIADQWVLADHMFQTQGSGSYTAHQDLIRGGTELGDPKTSKYSLVDNPSQPPWGCDYEGSSVTSLITRSGKYAPYVHKGPPPCSDDFPSSGRKYKTLRDLFDASGVSWKYYSPCYKGSPPSSGCSSSGCVLCAGGTLNAFDTIAPVRNGPEWGTNVSMPETNIFNDISNGALPEVSWVIPEDQNSDHPGDGTMDDGPSWVASVVNAVGQSSYWNSSAIVVMWDDWGGFYDHVAPQQLDFGGLGFRVPMLILSPYAKKGTSSQGGYISSTPYESGSILRYIEDNWHLRRLGTSDVRAASIGNVFDYTQAPRGFTQIPSQHSIEYFRSRPTTLQHGDPE